MDKEKNMLSHIVGSFIGCFIGIFIGCFIGGTFIAHILWDIITKE